jgi:hypothetical protein
MHLRNLLFGLLALPLVAAEVSLDRVVVIGASVSRGFTESQPFGGEKAGRLRLDRYLDAALSAEHGPIINDANHLLFQAAETEARRQLVRLEKREPTVVVAIDFLFWFLYGHPSRTGDRLMLFDRGLELLSTIECPLVVGDIPDASAAIGHMLSAPMVPDADTLAEANRRLADWARVRPQVSVVPLSRFMHAVQRNEEIRVAGQTWPAGHSRDLLQPDQLHPEPEGCTALALAVLSSLESQGLAKEAVEWHPERVLRGALKEP